MKRWLAACAMVVALAACTTTSEVEPGLQVPAGPLVTHHVGCTSGASIQPSASGAFDVTVSRDGTYGANPVQNASKSVAWELYLPADWNSSLFAILNGARRLVVFHQGTIDPYDPLDLPNHSFPLYNEVVCNLLASNIAVAWTSNTETGYDLEGAYRATAPLISAVKAHGSEDPSRIYQVGFSQGGLLGPALLENAPALFDGALSICAPLDGMSAQLQYLGDARVLFDAYLQANYAPGATTVIPTSDPSAPAFAVEEGTPPDGDAYLPWEIARATHPDGTFDFDAYDYDPFGTPNLPADIRDLLWAQYEVDDNAALAYARNDAIRLPAYTPDILTYAATEVLYYAVRGVNQLLRKAGGVPYATPLSFPPGTPDTIDYVADVRATSYVSSWFDPSGDLQKPLVTMHTTDDPAVPYRHEVAYRNRVIGVGKSGLLRQQWVQRIGHCAFTPEELVVGLDGMIRWVEFGTEPPVGNITSTTDTPPTVSIASPSPNARVSGIVDVLVWASDNTGVARVDAFADGVFIGSDDAPEIVDGRRTWRITWDTSGLSSGTYALEAVAYEAVPSLPTGSDTPSSAMASMNVNVSEDGSIAPSIDAFTASSTAVPAGEDVVLTWTVTGTSPALTLSDGRGLALDVTGATSWTVQPTVYTEYTLTATNSAGSDTAAVEIYIVVDGTGAGD